MAVNAFKGENYKNVLRNKPNTGKCVSVNNTDSRLTKK